VYSACLFCHGSLGANEEFEVFPVGRRLAFDPAKGRLWVVCRKCGRWNLTPLEERWEAIEQCERRFRGTIRRLSTENVGLAHLGSGLSLVRVGNPLRPELAAWRYGRELGSRRIRRGLAISAGATGVAAVAAVAVATAGIGIAGAAGVLLSGYLVARHMPGGPVARVAADGGILDVRHEDLRRTAVFADDRRGGHSLLLHHRHGATSLHGDDASRALAKLMPAINPRGASTDVLVGAAEVLENAESVEDYVRWMLRLASHPQFGLLALPEASSLAFEMALNEEAERRAMDGELAALERAWREAEEIAAIADGMLIPPEIQQAIERFRRTVD
jgi:hypothetical protein